MAAHSVGYNLSRTLGPALGGFIIVRYGAATALSIFVGANLAGDRGAHVVARARAGSGRPCPPKD